MKFNLKKKPNIIMILIDAGAREDALNKVSYYQELKQESVFIQNLIAYSPYTIGSLNALFSGMNGNVNGVNGYYKSYNFDKKNIFTLTQYLKEAGYHTELDFVIDDAIPAQGFDKIRIFGRDETKDIDLIKRHSEVLTQLKDKQPFFTFLDYNKIALSLGAATKKYNNFSKEYFNNKEENLKQYTIWMQQSGNYLKNILGKIKQLGLYDDSLIIIFSDHGASVGDKVGEKIYGSYLYDYTIKCWAYFIYNKLSIGRDIIDMMRTIDLMPTILDILNIKQKNNYKPMQGKTFLSVMESKVHNT